MQDECEQMDNTPHWLGFCSKKHPKAGVTISIWVVGGWAEMGAAQQQLRGWWAVSGGELWPPPPAPCSFVCQARCQGKQYGVFPSRRRWEQVRKCRAIGSLSLTIISPSVMWKTSAQVGSWLLWCVSCGEVTTGQMAFFTALVGLQAVLRAAASQEILPCLSVHQTTKRDRSLFNRLRQQKALCWLLLCLSIQLEPLHPLLKHCFRLKH